MIRNDLLMYIQKYDGKVRIDIISIDVGSADTFFIPKGEYNVVSEIYFIRKSEIG